MARKRIVLRPLTSEERQAVHRLARSRTAPARLVQRARLIQLMVDDPELPATTAGQQVGFVAKAPGAYWVRRFNAEGLAGLEDKPRTGRPPTHGEDVRSQVIDLALHKPRTMGLPYELWSLTRLAAVVEARLGVRLVPSTIWTWLQEEGLAWKRQQSWFHDAAQHDPEFAEKRGHNPGLWDAAARHARHLP